MVTNEDLDRACPGNPPLLPADRLVDEQDALFVVTSDSLEVQLLRHPLHVHGPFGLLAAVPGAVCAGRSSTGTLVPRLSVHRAGVGTSWTSSAFATLAPTCVTL